MNQTTDVLNVITNSTQVIGNVLYYECHLTVEPVLDELRRESLRVILNLYGFRLAELLFQRKREDTPERSAKDSFATSRSDNMADITSRANDCMAHLRNSGFEVWRYKIEAAIVDVRYNKDEELASGARGPGKTRAFFDEFKKK